MEKVRCPNCYKKLKTSPVSNKNGILIGWLYRCSKCLEEWEPKEIEKLYNEQKTNSCCFESAVKKIAKIITTQYEVLIEQNATEKELHDKIVMLISDACGEVQVREGDWRTLYNIMENVLQSLKTCGTVANVKDAPKPKRKYTRKSPFLMPFRTDK